MTLVSDCRLSITQAREYGAPIFVGRGAAFSLDPTDAEPAPAEEAAEAEAADAEVDARAE